MTSTDSGLSVPDWPLSYGQYFPPMVGGIRFEHSHRVIAGAVGLFTFIFFGLLLKKEPRAWVRWLGAGVVLAVVLQALLGGLTVIYLLPKPISVAHACLGQTFFALVASIALFTSREWKTALPVYSEEAAPLKRLLAVTVLFIYFQLIAGSIVRHTEGGALGYHVILAFLVALHILFIVVRILKEPSLNQLAGHALWLAALTTGQIFLGVGAYIMKLVLEKGVQPRTAEVLITTAHQSVGALILALTLLLTLRAFRLVRPLENP